MTGSGGSLARLAIADTARRLGHADPVALVDELAEVDVRGLRAWHELSAAAGQSLSTGADRLGRAVSAVAQAWSSPVPRASVDLHRQAAREAHEVIGRQLDVALDTIGTLESTRISASAELDRAEDRIVGTGWPPSEDLLTWATTTGCLPTVAATIGGLAQTVQQLGRRNDAALEALTAALREDPSAPVDTLRAIMPAAFPGASPPREPARAPVDQDNLDRLAVDLRSSDISVLIAARGVQAALDQARTAGGNAQLLVYESASSSSQGRAAISIGDITTADNVAALAPGVGSSPTSMIEGIDDAVALRDRAQQLEGSSRTAVVAWYGYDVPLAALGGSPMTPGATAADLATTVNDMAARAGGGQLVQDLDTFRQWAPPDARFIGIGFSMGSTTVSAAAARRAGFDDLVMLGSPGASVEVETADDYPGMTPDHVWVGSLDNDPITKGITDGAAELLNGLGLNPFQPTPFGPDPADADFGARVMDLTSNAPDVSVQLGGPFGLLTSAAANEMLDLQLNHQQGNYLSGPSLDAVAAVVVGDYDAVPLRPGR
ncbi:MAG: alpha/beta hydrolase [Nakamurella multipartita]|jgi:hypothetical protein